MNARPPAAPARFPQAWLFLCCLVMGTALACASARAGEPSPLLSPGEQPLAVVHADRASIAAEILQTRQLRALRLDARDFSGRLPGMDVTVASLKNFLSALAAANATDLWYALLQDGGTIREQTAALGWTTPASDKTTPPAPAETTGGTAGETIGERVGKITGETVGEIPGEITGGTPNTERLASGALRTTIARDAATRESLHAGALARPAPWRASLSRFLARRDDTAGILASARPLTGFAALAGGIELRPLCARYGLSFPDSAQLELFNNAGDLGFSLRLNSLVPPDASAAPPQSSVRQTRLTFRKEALVEVVVPAPERFFRRLPFESGLLALANLNRSALSPQAATAAAWRREDGEIAWAVVFLVADREAFRTQIRRVELLLESFPVFSVALADALSPSGHALRTVRAGNFTCAAGLASGEGVSTVPLRTRRAGRRWRRRRHRCRNNSAWNSPRRPCWKPSPSATPATSPLTARTRF